MAKTSYSTSSAEKKQLWEEKFFRDTVKTSFFNKGMSEDGTQPIQTKRALEKAKGDQVNYFIRYTPTNVGVGPGTPMEGNEDKLLTASNSVNLTRRRYAVRDDGELTRQRVFFSIDVESEAALKEWASEWIDTECFHILSHAITKTAFLNGTAKVTPTKQFFAGSATSTATLTAADLITPGLISKVRAFANQTNNHARVAVRPIRIGGREYFWMIVHPDVAFDLKRNSEYLTNLRDCLERSPQHPIFTGALGVSHDGVIFHEHENIEIFTNGGAGNNVPYAHNLFLGQQAALWAWGMDAMTITRKKFDYDEEHGFQIAMTYGAAKAKFTKPGGLAADFGSIAIYTSRTQITDV